MSVSSHRLQKPKIKGESDQNPHLHIILYVNVASVSASAMFVSHTSTGGNGAINGPPATGLEPAALQSPPQYEKGGEEE